MIEKLSYIQMFFFLPEEVVALFWCRLKVGAKAKRRVINNTRRNKTKWKNVRDGSWRQWRKFGWKGGIFDFAKVSKKNRKFDLALIRTQFTQCTSFTFSGEFHVLSLRSETARERLWDSTIFWYDRNVNNFQISMFCHFFSSIFKNTLLLSS